MPLRTAQSTMADYRQDTTITQGHKIPIVCCRRRTLTMVV